MVDWVEYVKQNSEISDTNCWEWKGKRDLKTDRPIMSGWHNNGDVFKNLSVQKVVHQYSGNMKTYCLDRLKLKENCNTAYCCNPEHLEEIS